MVNRESLYNRVSSKFCPYDTWDIETAIDHLETAGLNPEILYDICADAAMNYDMSINNLDCVAEVYRHLANIAIDELQLNTENWVSPEDDLNVAGNYLCTAFYVSTNTLEKLNEHLNQLEDFDIKAISPVVKWLFEELSFEYEPKETE